MRAIESEHPDRFKFIYSKDSGTTGRFEVTLYMNQTDDSKPGKLLHSKAETK